MFSREEGKPLVWLHGEIKSPPFGTSARREAGFLLRRLQRGEQLWMPHSKPVPAVGRRCQELRIIDRTVTWRIIYRSDPDVVLILDVFQKATRKTPCGVVENCRRRLRLYESLLGEDQ